MQSRAGRRRGAEQVVGDGEDAAGRSSPELPVGSSSLSCSELTKMKFANSAGKHKTQCRAGRWCDAERWSERWSEVRQVEYRQRRASGSRLGYALAR